MARPASGSSSRPGSAAAQQQPPSHAQSLDLEDEGELMGMSPDVGAPGMAGAGFQAFLQEQAKGASGGLQWQG